MKKHEFDGVTSRPLFPINKSWGKINIFDLVSVVLGFINREMNFVVLSFSSYELCNCHRVPSFKIKSQLLIFFLFFFSLLFVEAFFPVQ